MQFSRSLLLRVISASLGVWLSVGWAHVVHADALVLIEPNATVSAVTNEELITEARMRGVPEEPLITVLKDPEKVRQMAINVYIRRVLAEDARAAGLDKQPEVGRTLRLAQERLLSDLRLKDIVNAKIDEATIAKLAQHEYNTNLVRYFTIEKVHVRHILIDDKDRQQALDKAHRVLAELKGGADFAELAAQHSADPGSKAKGGDLGMFGRGKMVKQFEDAAFSLVNPGDLSEPIETKFGLHILRLEAREPATRKSFAEVKDEIEKQVVGRIQADRTKAVSEDIKSRAVFNEAGINAMSEQFKAK